MSEVPLEAGTGTYHAGRLCVVSRTNPKVLNRGLLILCHFSVEVCVFSVWVC